MCRKRPFNWRLLPGSPLARAGCCGTCRSRPAAPSAASTRRAARNSGHNMVLRGGFFGCSAARIEVVAGWQKTWSTMMARLPWWLHLSNSRAFLPVHRQREPRETGDWLRHKLHSPIHLPPLVTRLPSSLLLLTKGSIVYTSHVHGCNHRVTRHLDECFFPVRRRPHAPSLQLASIQKNQRAPVAASLWV